ncbi:MAG: D-alanyl-lipoteichoic acid biosynthesis protein DltD [Bacteroidales bacterium]
MKKFIYLHLLPILLAIIILFFSITRIHNIFLQEEENQNSLSNYINNFKDNSAFEDQFLLSNDSADIIYLLGSSELTSATEASPYNFISNNFKTKVIGVGHAGNQCFSIYSQLLANANKLKDAPVIIILSPSWFHSKDAKGTTSTVFLEYNSDKFLESILNNNDTSLSEFKGYETKRINDFYSEINNPSLNLRGLSIENQSNKSFPHYLAYQPVIKTHDIIKKIRSVFIRDDYKANYQPYNRQPILSENVIINWDSLFNNSRQEQINNSKNNSWGINDKYYKDNIKGENGRIKLVDNKYNQELKDFYMLIKLLHVKKANASFIILPLNPYYYNNSDNLTPLIKELEIELRKNNFSYLNFWNSDSNTFEKEILFDIMHLSKYGWYKADKFIVETYNLVK